MALELPCHHYFGESILYREQAGLYFAERKYAGGFQTPWHTHEQPYVCLILEGRGTQDLGNRKRVLQPLTLLFVPGGQVQSESFVGGPGRTFSFELDPRSVRRLKELGFQAERPVEEAAGQTATLACRLRTECYATDQASRLAVEGLVLEILAGLLRHGEAGLSPGHAPWLSKVLDILHDGFSEKLSLCEIAREVRVHPVYLAASFRRRFGTTIGAYLRQLRVHAACRQIERLEKPLAQIALDAGFSNQAHFSRIFKRILGMTPARYRADFTHIKKRQTSFRSGKN